MRRLSRFWMSCSFVFAVALSASAQTPGADPLKRSGFFGAQMSVINDEQADALKLGSTKGVLVVSTLPGSSAEAAGIAKDDVVTAVDGKQIEKLPDFLVLMRKAKAGDKVTLSIKRKGEDKSIPVTLKPRTLEKSDAFEVIYGSVPSKGGRLRTITTRPKGEGKFPALFIIQGLGGFSIEAAPNGPGIYTKFIERFGSNGYVTFRVEKTGQGDSEGGPTQDADFDTELDGYVQGIKALKAMDFVDTDNIVVFGHSMGGIMGPLVAKEAPIKGIAVYGTGSKTWTEYMLENTRRQMALAGASASSIDDGMRKDASIYYLLHTAGKTPEEIRKLHPELSYRLGELLQDDKYFSGRHYSFFKQLSNKNLAEAWESFDGYSFAIWGKADYISTEFDHAMIAEIANAKKPGHGRFLALEGTDHVFNRAASQEVAHSQFGKPGGQFNGEIIDILFDWAGKITKTKK